jgi:DNA-binding CsgD family transcriptional regulator
VRTVSPVLAGRSDELTQLQSAYDETRGGRAVTVLLSGEAGIGKTRLLTEFTAGLSSDVVVLTGGCLETGGESAAFVPFIAVGKQLRRVFGETELFPPSAGTGAEGRGRLFGEVLSVFERIAADRPVVLVIEDLHWADPATRELFVYLARNLETGSVLVIGTVRTGEIDMSHPVNRLLAELGRRNEVISLDLGPLDQGAVGRQLTAITGHQNSTAANRIYARSGGNPLFVEALAQTEDTGTTTLRALLLSRIAGLPEPSRQLLSTASASSAPVSDGLLTAVHPFAVDALRLLVDRDQLIVTEDGYAFRHALIREAVYADLLPGERTRLHAAFARALTDKPSLSTHARPAAELADHWYAADVPDEALRTAYAAAREARSNVGYAEEVRLLTRVLKLWDRVAEPASVIGVDRVTVLEQVATSAQFAAESDTGIDACTEALALLDPADEPDRVARLLERRTRLKIQTDLSGLDDLQLALKLATGPDTRARILCTTASTLSVTGRVEEALPTAVEAAELAAVVGDDSVRAMALAIRGMLEGRAPNHDAAVGRELLQKARGLATGCGDHYTALTATLWEAAISWGAAPFSPQAHQLMDAVHTAEQVGMRRARGAILASSASTRLFALGRWDAALELIEDQHDPELPTVYDAYLRLNRAHIMLGRGDLDAVRTDLDRLDELIGADLEVLFRVDWLQLSIGLAAAQADYRTADRRLGEFLAIGRDDLVPLDVVVDAARMLRSWRAAHPRDQQVSQHIAERRDALGRLTVDPLAHDDGYRLILEAELGPGKLADWDAAADYWRRLGARWKVARTLTRAAEVALADSNRGGARLRLREAIELATDIGAPPLLEHLTALARRARLEDEPAAHALPFGLTHREYDVLRVVAAGKSNREIAAELFISPRTVGIHLSRLLTKLGAATRTEAAAVAHRNGLLEQ